MTPDTNKPIWLVWLQNKETGTITGFNHGADNADEALENIATSFFDATFDTNISLDIDENCEGYTMKKESCCDKKIPFPKDNMKLLKIQRFEPNDIEGMMKARNEDGEGRYKNRKGNNS